MIGDTEKSTSWGTGIEQQSIGFVAYGPSGEHLAALARHSDEVLNAFLLMAGRQDLMVATKLAAAEQAILELLIAVQSLSNDAKD